VLTAVADPQALHDWAIRNGAVPTTEPAWATAGTEIAVAPEHADGGLLLNLTPQIVLPGAAGQASRRIPVKVCATSVLTKRGIPSTLEGFPGTDPEFYRLFFGALESKDDTLTRVTVAAVNDYPTSAPAR